MDQGRAKMMSAEAVKKQFGLTAYRVIAYKDASSVCPAFSHRNVPVLPE